MVDNQIQIPLLKSLFRVLQCLLVVPVHHGQVLVARGKQRDVLGYYTELTSLSPAREALDAYD